MFLLPALFLPLVFGLAIHRLVDIPRKLWRGKLRLPGKQRILLHAATIAAYGVLLGYTIALGAALVHALLAAQDRLSAYLALLGYVAAYPVVYFLAAWVFYYGLQPTPDSAHQI
jgi:hypothetical protein